MEQKHVEISMILMSVIPAVRGTMHVGKPVLLLGLAAAMDIGHVDRPMVLLLVMVLGLVMVMILG